MTPTRRSNEPTQDPPARHAGWSHDWQSKWSHEPGRKPATPVPCSWQATIRAKIILAAAHGHTNAAIAADLGVHVDTVRKWRKRYARSGLAGLKDLPRPGRPLILLHDPSRVAQYGSRMISRDNNDLTAHNTAALCDAVGLDYRDALHWNVVPWWVADPDLRATGQARSLSAEAAAALPHLRKFLSMVESSVSKVVLVGKQAEHVWLQLQSDPLVRSFQWRACPHTSPLAYNRQENRTRTHAVFEWAAS